MERAVEGAVVLGAKAEGAKAVAVATKREKTAVVYFILDILVCQAKENYGIHCFTFIQGVAVLEAT